MCSKEKVVVVSKDGENKIPSNVEERLEIKDIYS
jgi:hypothetical protein